MCWAIWLEFYAVIETIDVSTFLSSDISNGFTISSIYLKIKRGKKHRKYVFPKKISLTGSNMHFLDSWVDTEDNYQCTIVSCLELFRTLLSANILDLCVYLFIRWCVCVVDVPCDVPEKMGKERGWIYLIYDHPVLVQILFQKCFVIAIKYQFQAQFNLIAT